MSVASGEMPIPNANMEYGTYSIYSANVDGKAKKLRFSTLIQLQLNTQNEILKIPDSFDNAYGTYGLKNRWMVTAPTRWRTKVWSRATFSHKLIKQIARVCYENVYVLRASPYGMVY